MTTGGPTGRRLAVGSQACATECAAGSTWAVNRALGARANGTWRRRPGRPAEYRNGRYSQRDRLAAGGLGARRSLQDVAQFDSLPGTRIGPVNLFVQNEAGIDGHTFAGPLPLIYQYFYGMHAGLSGHPLRG